MISSIKNPSKVSLSSDWLMKQKFTRKVAFFTAMALILFHFSTSDLLKQCINVTTHFGLSLSISLLLMAIVYFYIHMKYSYWNNLGVPCSQPFPIVGHTLRRLGITMHILKFYDDMYYNHNGKDFCGIYEFLKPGLLVGNLELIRNITSKDFEHFANRRVFPLAKMRGLCGQFTMDTIASCAFGIECEAMKEDRAAFAEMATRLFVLSPIRALKIIILLTVPFLAHWGQLLGIEFTSDEFHFFHKVVTETVRLRAQKGIRRGDFLDLMKETNKLSETAMTAQAVLFLLAGHNNTASALSFTMHLLATNQDVQERLRHELLKYQKKDSEDMEFEDLLKHPLLDGVIKESLRLYPADPNLERICTKDYQIPGTNVTVREGQRITIPIWSIHHDPSYWPEPESFKPERFLNSSSWDQNAFFPFGNGPRQCIGMKFVYLVAKVGIQKVLCNYRIIPAAQTVDPPPLNPKGFFTTQPLNGLPLSVVPLEG